MNENKKKTNKDKEEAKSLFAGLFEKNN
jgi:hypothetical protein